MTLHTRGPSDLRRDASGDPVFGFDTAFLARLERLAIAARRSVPGPAAGPRRSPERGSSVEFADFRDYSPGDDYRRIDWSALARLGRPYVRLYMAEQMTTLSLFLDHSRSMTYGEPSKSLTAARLAAVFSYIALQAYDRVAIAGIGGSIDEFVRGTSGKRNAPRIWRHIADVMERPVNATDLGTLRQYGSYLTGPGLAIVLSDFLTETDWRSGLMALKSLGQEVSAIQVLAPEELDPRLRGDWSLRDAETGRTVDVTVSPKVLKQYEEAIKAHTASLSEFCRRNGMAFLQVRSDASLERDVLVRLRAGGLLA